MFNKRDNYSDEEIIAGIQAGGIQYQRFCNYLFDTHGRMVFEGMKKFKLKQEDAVDVYAESITALCRHILSGKFRGDSKISTYLFTIFFNRCKNKLRDMKTNKFEFVDEIPDLPDRAKNMMHTIVEQESVDELIAYLTEIGEKCKQILLLREYYGYNFEEIAKKIGFKTAQSVSSMKYRCMEKLKKLIRDKK